MCRIAGFWDFGFKGEYDLVKVIVAMRDTLCHGGPDDAGDYIDRDMHLALGHRRLSVIDLSAAGHQPMRDETDKINITYNGEVYNFMEIKEELIKEGFNFISGSDTEVILNAYRRWGIDCVKRFRGMWAFAIWDSNRRELILCRDRFGVKPLYWYYKDGLFIFASELKSMHRHPGFSRELDEEGLSLYLKYGYINSPYSIFKNTHKLEPGKILIVDVNGKIREYRYWDAQETFLEAQEKKIEKNEIALIEECERVLAESFKLRMVADVPVGVFLSGGIDSSLVAALLQKKNGNHIKTFTIGFKEPEFNEAEWAKKAAAILGTEHHELYCSAEDAFEIVKEITQIYDEPFADSSAIPTFLLSRFAKEHIKVALSGEGADELFCGYERYWFLAEKAEKFPLRLSLPFILKLLSPEVASSICSRLKIFPKINNYCDVHKKLKDIFSAKDMGSRYDISVRTFFDSEIKNLGLPSGYGIYPYFTQDSLLDHFSRMMLFDINTYLPEDLLTKLDRATMAVSLEGREPFLDIEVFKIAASLPLHLKYRRGKTKYILREILGKYLPKDIIDRPKHGFTVPVHTWLKKELKDRYRGYLNEKNIKKEGIFDYRQISRVVSDFERYNGCNIARVWSLFVFESWKERWMS